MRVAAWETTHCPEDFIPAHRHSEAYLTIVLDGEYVEKSVDGQYRCLRGDVIIHPNYHMHGNVFEGYGVRTANFRIKGQGFKGEYAVYSGVPVADVLQSARHDPLHTIQSLQNEYGAKAKILGRHWLEAFAEHLSDCQIKTGVAEFARELGVSPEHVSRCFRKHYGVGASTFRQEIRLRSALKRLGHGESLARTAYASGYADQSHLTRAVRKATHMTPYKIQQHINSVQE